MSNYIASSTDLTSVANAIRTKGGTSAQLAFPAGFVSAIEAIPTGGGSTPPRLLNYEEITLASTATSANKLTVQLTPSDHCFVLIMIDTYPASPDSTEYIALIWGHGFFPAGGGGTVADILRPAGTIGNDSGMCTFYTNTGELSIGGSYGHFLAGTKYHVYQFEMGVS